MEQKNYEPVQNVRISVNEYAWAVNRTKLGRSISLARQYETSDENEIRKIYISLGGLVRTLSDNK